MNISIISPGGVTNFGERAILVGTVFFLRRDYPTARISIFGYDDIEDHDPSIARFLKENKVSTRSRIIKGSTFLNKVFWITKLLINPEKYLGEKDFSTLKMSDIVISKGQESFTGSYGFIHFIDSFLEAYIISRFNSKVTLLGHSIGPIKNWLQKVITKHALKRIDKIFVREEVSLDVLKKIGFPEENTNLMNDLAFIAIENFPYSKESKKDQCIVIPNASIIRNATDSELYISNLFKILRHIKNSGQEVILTSSVSATDWNNDFKICRKIKKLLPSLEIRRYKTLQELFRDIYRSKLVLSSRLHPIIFSIGLKTRVIAFSKAPKVIGLIAKNSPRELIINPFRETPKEEFKKIPV